MFRKLIKRLKNLLYQTYPLEMTGLVKIDPIAEHIRLLPRFKVYVPYNMGSPCPQKYQKGNAHVMNKCSLYPNQEQFKTTKEA